MSPLSGVAHILYLTDLSAAAGVAYQHAVMLAQRLHAQVHILYWTGHIGYTWTNPAGGALRVADLTAGSAMAAGARGPAARPDLKQVMAFNAAAVATGGEGVDLVVLGIESQESMERMSYESLAEVLLRDLRCPLWVVGPRGQTSGWLERSAAEARLSEVHTVSSPRRVLYASPLRHDGRAPALAQYFSGAEDGELTLLHVLPFSRTTSAEDADPGGSDFDQAARALTALLDDVPPHHLRVRVRSAVSRAEVILEESASSDLIVLPAPSISAWELVGGGTITGIVEEARCPVLLVPESWNGVPGGHPETR